MYQNNYNPINQIDSQIRQLTEMRSQYQPQQAPITNVINTQPVQNNVLETKILENGETIEGIIIDKRTVFIDEKNSVVAIKEINGDISKRYNIIVPKDEKDLKIEELEQKLNKMEEMINARNFTVNANDEGWKSDGSSPKPNQPKPSSQPSMANGTTVKQVGQPTTDIK